jgi:hypothetical protein
MKVSREGEVCTAHKTPAMSLPSKPSSLVDKPYSTEQAFHGTSVDSANAIAKEGFVIPREPSTEHRFGPGAYFWENSSEAAKNFASQVLRIPPEKICIIRSKLSCNRLLDLLISAHFRPYQVVAGWLAREKHIEVQDVKPGAVLSVMAAAGWIDGARVLAPHKNQFSSVCRDKSLYGPTDVIVCVYHPSNIVVLETRAA